MINPSVVQDDDLLVLIAAARLGNQAACAAIYQRYVRATYRLAYGVLLDEQDAEEVVQDSFAYAFRNLARYDPTMSAFRTWLYTITMSRCRNKRRRKRLFTVDLAERIEQLSAKGSHPERVVEQRSVREIIFEALGKLSPKLREAVVLRYFDGLTYREMADVLGCPQKTAESRVRLAHEALYSILVEQRDVLTECLFGEGV